MTAPERPESGTVEYVAPESLEEPKRAPNRTVFRLTPPQQANLIGFFSLFASALFIGAAAIWDEDLLPPLSFYIYSVVVYVLFWWSFLLNYVNLDTIKTAYRTAVDIVTQTREEHDAGQPSGLARIFAPRKVERPAAAEFPRHDVVRILALAAGIIVQAAWLTIYSGGPFASPYSQILLAMALLAPSVAWRPGSIVAAYGLTALISLGFHWAFDSRPEPSANWYVATTMMVLLLSGWIAAVTRQRGK